MREHPNFPWHFPSDQPDTIKSKELKDIIYKEATPSFLASLLLVPLIPAFMLGSLLRKKYLGNATRKVVGLTVNVETPMEGRYIVPLEQLLEMVEELEVKQVLVRIPLADVARLEIYLEHCAPIPTIWWSNGDCPSLSLVISFYSKKQKNVSQRTRFLKLSSNTKKNKPCTLYQRVF